MGLTKLRNRFFQQIFRLTRSLTLDVRGVVLNDAGEVLLIRHTYTPGWYFPGGGVEKRETCELALERELIEEAGIKIAGKPELFSVYANHKLFPNDHVLVYVIRQWTQVKATSVGEIAETGFFALDQLPEAITPGTRRRLEELFYQKDISPHWTI